MRKTDKSAKQNKPPKAKVEGGGIGTLKPTKEEIAENRKILKHAQKLAKNKKIIRIPQGYSTEFEKMKAEINARKKKKNCGLEMDKKYISELLEKRKRLRNFIKFPYQYEELNENLEDKVKKSKTDLNFIQKEIDKFYKKKIAH